MSDVFQDAAWILHRDGLPIIALSILAMAPLEAAIVRLHLHNPGRPYSPLGIAYTILVPWLLQSVIASLYNGGLAWGVSKRLHGEHTSLAAMAGHALRRWPTMIRVQVSLGAATIGGLILLVGPGLVVASRWLVAPQVIAIEGGGVRDAFARSAYLTKGRRWLAVGVFVLKMVAYYGGFYALALPLRALIRPSLGDPLPMALYQYLFNSLYVALFMSLAVIFYTAFFHRLVAARGSRGEIAAQVFD
jgi:hypothetical protein